LVRGGKLLLAGLLLLSLAPRGIKSTNHQLLKALPKRAAAVAAGIGAGGHKVATNENASPDTGLLRQSDQATLSGGQTAAKEPIHYRNKAIVLLYHDFADKEADITITPEKFRKHMEMLRDHHYHTIKMSDFIRFLAGVGQIPPNAVVITSDDGYESVYRFAYPILKKLGYTATVFLIVCHAGTVDNGSTYLTWEEMKEMKRDGFNFLSHTYNLHASALNAEGVPVSPLANRVWIKALNRVETEQEYEHKVEADLTKAKLILQQRLGETLPVLCLPHGESSRRLLDLASQLGIRYIFTTDPGINRPGDTQIKRINAGMPYVTADVLLGKLKEYDEAVN
jgi:biofilm PGA synthesis lipoprotein PgaB